MLPLTFSEMNSNLYLRELMFNCAKTNFFNLLQRKDFNILLRHVTLWWNIVFSELHSSTIKSALLSLCSQFKVLNNSMIKVPPSVLEILLFKWSLPLLKYCALILLVLSIKQMFLFLRSSLRSVFNSSLFYSVSCCQF